MKTTVKFNPRQTVLRGLKLARDTVAPTLGPLGGTVLIDNFGDKIDFTPVYDTRDGFTALSKVNLNGDCRIGLEVAKSVVTEVKSKVGDGSTSVILMLYYLVKEGHKLIESGYSPVVISREFQDLTESICDAMDDFSSPITNKEHLFRIAFVACKSTELSNLITNAFLYAGSNGLIMIEETKPLHCELEIVSGMQIDRGYVNEMFINSPNSLECVLENVNVLVTDYELVSVDAAKVLWNFISKSPLLVIAPHYEMPFLSTIFVSGKTKEMCCIRSPAFGERSRDMAEDIAIYADASFITKESGMKMSKITEKDLGFVRKAVIKKDSTVLIGGRGETKERISLLEAQSKYLKSEFDANRSLERITRLNENIVTIKIGGNKEYDIQKTKRLVEDAISSTRSAVTSGLVPGTFLSYIYAMRQISLDKYPLANNVFSNMFKSLFSEIISRKREPMVLLQNILDNSDQYTSYNILTDTISSDIVDSSLMCQTILRSAVSAACSILNSEAIVAMK